MSRQPDARFFDASAPLSLAELAEITGARLARGDPTTRIACVATLERAEAAAVAFITGRKHLAALEVTKAEAVFAEEGMAERAPRDCAVLTTRLPQAAWVAAADRLHTPRTHLSATLAIHPDADLEAGVEVGRDVTIGPGARIGTGTMLGAGAVIGPGVTIGRDGYIGPHVVIGFALIGDRVRIHAGAIIGEAGFGAVAGPVGVIDVPQLGRVILQDGVTIGANSCVDRGAFDDTVIGENTKIDNLVQIAHNVTIGRNCVLAAFCGISGSVAIGDGAMLGGRVGIADHVVIGAGARLAAASGVVKDIPAGESWGGTPARPVRQWIRETAWTAAMAARRAGRGLEA